MVFLDITGYNTGLKQLTPHVDLDNTSWDTIEGHIRFWSSNVTKNVQKTPRKTTHFQF